jgi:hypothetical protein
MKSELGIERGFEDEILREQVRLAMKQLPTMQTASFLVALVISYTVSAPNTPRSSAMNHQNSKRICRAASKAFVRKTASTFSM